MSNKTRLEKEIDKIYWSVFNKVFKTYKLSLYRGRLDFLKDGLLRLQNSKEYKEFSEKFAKELSKIGINYQKGLWRKYFKAAKEKRVVGLPSTYNEFQLEMMKKAVIHNFKMIQSIPSKVLEVYQYKYATTLLQQVAEGSIGRGSFEKQLKEHGHKHSRIIARTETAKLQTSILENRSRDIGSIAYIWLSSRDSRTRPSHKMMNGVLVFWRQENEKPHLDNMIGNAGEFPNCRCSPQPIFDESDIKESFVKVYDYRTHEIITMRKQEVIKALEKGSLN